jgi:hypothetical protein
MSKRVIMLAAAAALASFTAAPSMAQVAVDVPGVGVRVGEPHYRDYDRPRYREYREREVRYGRGCKTVTIHRDDGSMKRIRRCD